MSFKDTTAILMCITVLCCCIFTLGQLVLFLSSHSPLKQNRYPPFVYLGNLESLWLQILTNICLAGFFILQHSLQSHESVKQFLNGKGLQVFERLLYNLGSCFALQVLMQLWHPTSEWVVWEVSTSAHPVAWWIFTAVHCIAWLFIYGGCYVMDITELLGARQVIYSLQGWPDPLSLKSEGLRRMYSHMRHPSFSALVVLLFFHPLMQMDRLLLAYAFLLYMLLGTRVDDVDYCYQRRMLQRKERDLS
ncbi:nurim homolog [Argiope bruennichi]|uniref:nurim homolog n=1 Tax=Argiope bruennichi TaxID=94029 RepID=UPI002494CED3|nr:nurim homolog [Argiope bruennichi]